MLWAITVTLFILWLIGVVILPALGPMVHLLLIFAFIALVLQLTSQSRA